MQALRQFIPEWLPDGLTTTRAPFIEAARARGELYIDQPLELYSAENHATWRRLYARMRGPWERYANDRFLDGIAALALPSMRVPWLDEVNRFLAPRTGFRCRAVSGYVPAYLFFDSLARREFPTTITIRPTESIDYLPEPDIFHDLAGHVPMHTDPAFAEALVRFGQCARTAVEIGSGIRNHDERLERVTSIIKALARFFWFTVEFGLMREGDGLRVYGSGLLSSSGEIEHAIISPKVQRSDLRLDWVVHQSFEINRFQPLLFIVESFDHLFELAGTLERWMRDGRLDHVAPGEPGLSLADLNSFLQACSAA